MKNIEENGTVKSTRPYKMKFFKKVISAIGIATLTTAMFLGVAFTFTGCAPEGPVNEDPPIVQPYPDDPDDPVVDPDDPTVDPDDPTIDPDDPVVDPDDPTVDPDDPTVDPDDPTVDPDDPVVDPDDPVVDPEPEVPDTLEELMQEGNEEYQTKVTETLDSNVYEKVIKNIVGSNYDLEKVDNVEWRLVTTDDNSTIDKIYITFNYNVSDTSRTFVYASVAPVTDITITDLINNDTEKLESAFDEGNPFVAGAKYVNEYGFNYNPTIQETRSELLDAVNKKLAEDGIITAVNENTQSFIKDNGTSIDTVLNGTARKIVIMNLTESGYEEVSICLKENQSNNNDTTLIENLNDGHYYEVESARKSGEFSGTSINNDSLQEETVTVSGYKLVYTNDKGEREEYDLEY